MNIATVPNYKNYKLPPEEERTAAYRIVAHYLDWAAKHHPGAFTPWSVVLRVIQQRGSTPRESNQEVQLLRKRATAVRRTLIAEYQREMENLPGIGVRATADSLDVIKSRVVAQQARLSSAARSFQATANLVDLSEIPNNAETRPVKEWFSQAVVPSLDRLDKLQKQLALPPALLPAKKE